MAIQMSITELLPFVPPTSRAAKTIANLFPDFSLHHYRAIAIPRNPSHLKPQTDNHPDFPKRTVRHAGPNPAP
jgi:hypothetical protein